MLDPKGNEDQLRDQNVKPDDETIQDSNWDEHQRIDEEGNELSPDDIK